MAKIISQSSEHNSPMPAWDLCNNTKYIGKLARRYPIKTDDDVRFMITARGVYALNSTNYVTETSSSLYTLLPVGTRIELEQV